MSDTLDLTSHSLVAISKDSLGALRASLARAHLQRGGLIVAATHAPLGIDGARELKLGGGA